MRQAPVKYLPLAIKIAAARRRLSRWEFSATNGLKNHAANHSMPTDLNATGCGEDSERPGSYAPTTTATGLGEDVGAEENVRAERVSFSDNKRRANEMGERKHATGG
ncbi:hypothetical protein Adt_10879 [Abeliophyllum distichum]|uniref:Uncharacterized protein n=1 Tax=Abeliophyllum distichum TaxID=126358 RepID=A0ABD1ULA1_9LAMI